jgi:hypothetical protein
VPVMCLLQSASRLREEQEGRVRQSARVRA